MAEIKSAATSNCRDRIKKPQIFDLLSTGEPSTSRKVYYMLKYALTTRHYYQFFVLSGWNLSQIYFLKEIIL